LSAFPIISLSSWFIRIFQDPPLSYIGAKIFLNILRSNILRCCSSRFVNVQALHPYATTSLIKLLYIFSFEFLVNALDFINFPHEW
jgi:hypothetical protein